MADLSTTRSHRFGALKSEMILERRMFIDTFFGRCELIPHGLDEQPEHTVSMGYVELEERFNHYRMAIWDKGEWRDHKRRQFASPVVAWFSLVKPDGKPLF